MFRSLAALSLVGTAFGQLAGTNTAEVHPSLPIQICTASGCTTEQTSAVLDANWRWAHASTGYTNCYTGNAFNATICNTPAACAANCAIDGADYAGTYGITTPTSGALKLGFVTNNANGQNVGSRTYLMKAGSTTAYRMFDLLNQEFTFDVDVSNLPCGLNGAVYFTAMDADGGMAKNPGNKAGAKYGTGYCDAQCPQDLKFVNGVANSAGWNGTSANSGKGQIGSCCSEMDIWEANLDSAAFTPHPCKGTGIQECTSDQTCGNGAYGNQGICDKAGCDFNSYRQGNKNFYGTGMTVDTSKPFTIVTQFITDSGTATGNLVEIKRFYVQGGKTIPNSVSTIAGTSGNSITDSFCAAQKTAFNDTNYFATLGGLKTLGTAAENMVLVLSIWDDTSVAMNWLDSEYPPTADPSAPGVTRGRCDPAAGVAATVEKAHPDAAVVYSNIKFGAINSTFASGSAAAAPAPVPVPAPSSPATPAPVSSAPAAPVPTTSTATAAKYGQCGGIGWTGATTCAAGSTCKASGAYYSQCL